MILPLDLLFLTLLTSSVFLFNEGKKYVQLRRLRMKQFEEEEDGDGLCPGGVGSGDPRKDVERMRRIINGGTMRTI